MPKATDKHRVWIEIKPKVDTPEGWQEAVELANNMLNKLSERNQQRDTFEYVVYEDKFGRECAELQLIMGGGSYTVQTDNGAWFNLDYLGRKEEK